MGEALEYAEDGEGELAECGDAAHDGEEGDEVELTDDFADTGGGDVPQVDDAAETTEDEADGDA
jgi:hypothetical protein